MKLTSNLSYCAVIIWYNPSQSDIENTQNLAEIIPCILVIDNSDRSNSSHVTKDNIQYYPLYNNLGIATALNYGFQKALELGFRYALSLDQDSNFQENDLVQFEEHAAELFKDDSVAIVAASTIENTKLTTPYIKKTNITSGSMTCLSAWRKVGKFKDEFFIDHVDHEFCLRLTRAGFFIYSLPKIKMQHMFGSPMTRVVFGKKFSSHGYSKYRMYYYFRNRLYLSKLRNEAKLPVLRFLFKKLLYCMIVEPDRNAKLYYASRGVYDFLRGKLGKLNDD